MTGASGGLISIEGVGGHDAGVYADAPAGTASVTTNNGLTVSVGLLGGTFDAGLDAIGTSAIVNVGANDILRVGNATLTTNSAGALAVGPTANLTTGSGVSISVLGTTQIAGLEGNSTGLALLSVGDNNTINVGVAGVTTNSAAVYGLSAGATANVVLGNGELITVVGQSVLAGVFGNAAGDALVTIGNQSTGSGINVTGTVVPTTIAPGTLVAGAYAVAGGNGTIQIGTTPIRVTGGYGIEDTSLGFATVTTAGNVVSFNGVGIYAASGAANVTVTLNGANRVTGLGNVTLPAIDVEQSGNRTSTINIGARAFVAANSGANTAVALATQSTEGSIVVNDSGELFGEVRFGSLIDAVIFPSNTTINVMAGGTWETDGLNTFGNSTVGPAHDAVDIAGTLATGVNTTFVFGNTTTNTITVESTGDFSIAPSSGGVLTLTAGAGTITLNNAGLMDLFSDVAGTVQVFAPTTTYNGQGGEIDVTSQLGGPGGLSDQVHVATATGTGTFAVFDDGSAAPAHVTTANPIVLLTATGANTAVFTLNGNSTGYHLFGPSPVDAGLVKGLWMYEIANNVQVAGQNDTVLVSTPSPLAFEMPVIATVAQNIWYMTAPWQDRQADLRDSALLQPGSLGAGFTPGVWLKAVGDWTDRTDRLDPPAGFLFDL